MPYFAEGARGVLITPLRKFFGLNRAADPVFDEFDAELTAKVRAHQESNAKDPTGRVDEKLYEELASPDPWPSLFKRLLMLVASIEGHGYAREIRADVDDRDPAGLTAGVIGFTAASGSLLSVLNRIDVAILNLALTASGITNDEPQRFHDLLKLAESGDDVTRRRQAIGLFLSKPGKQVLPRWNAFFKAVLPTPKGVDAQEKQAEKEYLARAEKLFAGYGFTTELGLALAFSMAVNTRMFEVQTPAGPERQRRIFAASNIAERLKRDFVVNYERRHIGLATGRGFPNQRFVELVRWGFDDRDTPPPARSRILSLGFSSAPAMKALPQLEAAAVAAKVVDERVLETPAVRERIKAAAFPFPDFSNAWRDDLLKSANRAPRARRIELFSELNELPVSCLVLGSSSAGKTLMFTKGAPAGVAAVNNILTWWRTNDLWFPLCPPMQSALVILYTPNGIAKKASFGHNIQNAIATINDKPPLVLGWEGAKLTFSSGGSEAMATAFFGELGPLIKPAEALTLDVLVFLSPEKIIQAWGKACHMAFAKDAKHSDLWRNKAGTKGCAAIAPDKSEWRAVAEPANGVFMERIA